MIARLKSAIKELQNKQDLRIQADKDEETVRINLCNEFSIEGGSTYDVISELKFMLANEVLRA